MFNKKEQGVENNSNVRILRHHEKYEALSDSIRSNCISSLSGSQHILASLSKSDMGFLELINANPRDFEQLIRQDAESKSVIPLDMKQSNDISDIRENVISIEDMDAKINTVIAQSTSST